MTKRKKWLLVYDDKTMRFVWSDFRAIIADGSLNFYNELQPAPQQVNEHVYAVAHGAWRDVFRPQDRLDVKEGEVAVLSTVGSEPRELVRNAGKLPRDVQ